MQHKPGSFSLALFPFLYSSFLHLSLRISTDNTHTHHLTYRDQPEREGQGGEEERARTRRERQRKERARRSRNESSIWETEFLYPSTWKGRGLSGSFLVQNTRGKDTTKPTPRPCLVLLSLNSVYCACSSGHLFCFFLLFFFFSYTCTPYCFCFSCPRAVLLLRISHRI